MVYLKKGLVWSTLIHALLGIALIAIIAGILFPIKDYVNEKFFDEEGASIFSPEARNLFPMDHGFPLRKRSLMIL